MATKTETLEELTVYDLNELKDIEYPIRVVCAAINTVIEPIVDPENFRGVCHGVEEIVKDVVVHGSEFYPRQIRVCKKIGGVAIDTFDKPKEQSEHNGFGKLILQAMFGDAYSATLDSGIYTGHLFIRDETPQHSTEVRHAA